MYNNNKILGIIPARGGSKGVPRKNLRELAGKPLLAWTIEAAKSSCLIDRVILSSEDDEIIKTARQYGLDVPFKRPESLALDETPGVEPVLHAMKELESDGYSHIVLLQPTSPLRKAEDIDEAIRLCLETKAPSCVSVCRSAHPPWWMFRIDVNNRLMPIMDAEALPLRRQDAPVAYQLNGSVYVAECDFLKQSKGFISPDTVAYVMPPERSLDIDTEIDLAIAEMILKSQQ